MRAVMRERFGDRLADAATSARHQRDLAVEIEWSIHREPLRFVIGGGGPHVAVYASCK